MILLGKIALGISGSLFLASVYTFRQGVIRVDVDESREKGSHVHLWFPAAAVPMSMHFVPGKYFRCSGSEGLNQWLPTMRVVTRELQKFPEADLVEVQDSQTHVHVRTHNGKLLIDVNDPEEKIHLVFPLETMENVTAELQRHLPHS